MRTSLILVLLLAISFPVVAPSLALGQDSAATLPACCRRAGAHHCMGRAQKISDSLHVVSQLCPHLPHPSTAPAQANNFALMPAGPVNFIGFPAPTAPQRAETQRRIARDRARQKRGPPTERL